jgi:hypothetical protein
MSKKAKESLAEVVSKHLTRIYLSQQQETTDNILGNNSGPPDSLRVSHPLSEKESLIQTVEVIAVQENIGHQTHPSEFSSTLIVSSDHKINRPLE